MADKPGIEVLFTIKSSYSFTRLVNRLSREYSFRKDSIWKNLKTGGSHKC